MKKFLGLSLIIFLFINCSKKETQQINRFVVDERSVSKVAKEKLADKVKLQLLPIETNDSSLLDLSSIQIRFDGDTIVMYDYSVNQFFLFDRKGQFIRNIDRRGQGPEEYLYGIWYKAKNGKLYVVDRDHIKIYDYNGNYLGNFEADNTRMGEIAVTDKDDVYIKAPYSFSYQLNALNKEGEVIWEALPSNEKMMNSQSPRGPEYHGIGEIGENIFVTVPMDQNIYLVKDTTMTVLASFDFGLDNIPDDFFDQDAEEVNNGFWDRRNQTNGKSGFVYFDYLFIDDNWILFNPVSNKLTKMGLADRRTGETYGFEAFPEVLQKLMSRHKYISEYDKTTGSFIISLSADKLKEDLEELKKEGNLKSFPELMLIDTDKINEEDNGFLLMIHLE